MGFSQGGLICIDFALFLEQPLGGIFSISGFSRNSKKKQMRYNQCQKETPIILSHGKEDDQVPAISSIQIYDELIKQGANVKLVLYKGKHKIGIECIRKIKEIIQNQVI